MQRDRGIGGSKPEIGVVHRRRIDDVLDKHLQRLLPSSSKGGKEKNELLWPGASLIGNNGRTVADRKDSMPRKKNEFEREESDTDQEELYASGTDVEDDVSWISWFCNSRGNEFFCEVDEDYIEDDFNLCGLSDQVSYYDHALDLILDYEFCPDADLFTDGQHEAVQSSAEMLYGLIHARYILTNKGLNAMLGKYKNCDFGRCPRVFCSGQPCLPIGQTDIHTTNTVKIYCPSCEDIYSPRSKYIDIDGAFFGTTFPHLFLMTYGYLKPQKQPKSYIPRIFGYKVHKQ